jgi:hypothetical protein
MNMHDFRLALCTNGYTPVPLFGKAPPAYGKNNKRKGLGDWQRLDNVTPAQVEMWGKTWPDAGNTGFLTRTTPTLDLDVLNEEAARAVETLVRERFEERGHFLVRIGKAPKRAIPFRTVEPFAKILANVVAPNGGAEKIEFLGDGQQLVADGIHPDTGKPYTWFGGDPTSVAHDELPYIHEAEARQLIEDIVALLVSDFGYRRAAERPKAKVNGGAIGADDWQYLITNIRDGNALHDSLRDLAAKMVKAGMKPGAVVNQLRAMMEASTVPHDERWQERFDSIPRLVDSAEAKYSEAPKIASGPPSTIEQTLATFSRAGCCCLARHLSSRCSALSLLIFWRVTRFGSASSRHRHRPKPRSSIPSRNCPTWCRPQR